MKTAAKDENGLLSLALSSRGGERRGGQIAKVRSAHRPLSLSSPGGERRGEEAAFAFESLYRFAVPEALRLTRHCR
jgi:hypothetical protein